MVLLLSDALVNQADLLRKILDLTVQLLPFGPVLKSFLRLLDQLLHFQMLLGELLLGLGCLLAFELEDPICLFHGI